MMFSLALSLVDDWNSGYVSLYIIAGKYLLLERLTLNKYRNISDIFKYSDEVRKKNETGIKKGHLLNILIDVFGILINSSFASSTC